MTTDSETKEQYLTFVRSRFLISVLLFVSHDFKLGIVLIHAFAIAITFARWRRHSEIQFANAFAIAITFAGWRQHSEATISPIRG